MKNRIFQIMKQEGLNQKDFAATTGINAGTLSSIFNGRTEPSLATAEKLHRRFPMLNMSWLMFGEGDMYLKENSDGENVSNGTNAIGSDLFAGVRNLITIRTPPGYHLQFCSSTSMILSRQSLAFKKW